MSPLLITDTCVLLNVLATECAGKVFVESGWRFAVCKRVVSEALVLHNRDTQETKTVDLDPFFRTDTLQRLELQTDAEYELLTDFAALMGGGGDTEAMCFALAESRSLQVAIDDERAIKRARRRFPGLAPVSTPEILRQWQNMEKIPQHQMRVLLLRIQTWASYFPGRNHACYQWWQTMLQE